MKAPLQVTSWLPRWMVESTGTMYGGSRFRSPPWHCSFPHCASLGTKWRVVKQHEVSPFLQPIPQLLLPNPHPLFHSHLCAQGKKPLSGSLPQFPWASPAEFTTWKQASGAGLEPGEHEQGCRQSRSRSAGLRYPCPSPLESKTAQTRGWGWVHASLTRPPELLALLLQRGTRAVPTVATAAGAGRAVQ